MSICSSSRPEQPNQGVGVPCPCLGHVPSPQRSQILSTSAIVKEALGIVSCSRGARTPEIHGGKQRYHYRAGLSYKRRQLMLVTDIRLRVDVWRREHTLEPGCSSRSNPSHAAVFTVDTGGYHGYSVSPPGHRTETGRTSTETGPQQEKVIRRIYAHKFETRNSVFCA